MLSERPVSAHRASKKRPVNIIFRKPPDSSDPPAKFRAMHLKIASYAPIKGPALLKNLHPVLRCADALKRASAPWISVCPEPAVFCRLFVEVDAHCWAFYDDPCHFFAEGSKWKLNNLSHGDPQTETERKPNIHYTTSCICNFEMPFII